MDAMIFAAGLGTRLRPLTDGLPKALVPVGGTPVLEHVAKRLVDAGADRLIINTHPFPDMVEAFVEERGRFGVDVHFSHEPGAPLDTGGGVAKARPLFSGGPFFMHNCDIMSDIDLHALKGAHEASGALATLAVLPPSEERYLIFDERGLCGFSPRGGGDDRYARDPVGTVEKRDFTGIHIASPELLDTLPAGGGTFSIILHYIELARRGQVIGFHDQPGATWIDIGSHEKLAEAERLLAGAD